MEPIALNMVCAHFCLTDTLMPISLYDTSWRKHSVSAVNANLHAGYMPLIGFVPGTQVFVLWPNILSIIHIVYYCRYPLQFTLIQSKQNVRLSECPIQLIWCELLLQCIFMCASSQFNYLLIFTMWPSKPRCFINLIASRVQMHNPIKFASSMVRNSRILLSSKSMDWL